MYWMLVYIESNTKHYSKLVDKIGLKSKQVLLKLALSKKRCKTLEDSEVIVFE